MTDVLPSRNVEGTYSFASQPQAIINKAKYRAKDCRQDELPAAGFGNLMYDRRVIRGNTYALQVLPAQAQMDPVDFQRQIHRRRKQISKQRAKEKFRPTSPTTLEGRLHKPIQTELYLEELTDYVEEADVDCQTDQFLDRPPTPLFVPAKCGEDVATQIYEGDLFDFDLEVIPVLEVLIGKTIEQSLLEVMEEEELACIRKQQAEFEELRQADLAEVHRLMERERRLREEKEKRKQEAIRVAEQERDLAAKVAAQAFSRAYLADLQASVFKNLTDHGYFYDPVEYDVENGFLPWLMAEIEEELEVENRARVLLDGLIREAVQERHYEYRRLELVEAEDSLNMTAGSALVQGSSDGPSVEQNRESEEQVKENAEEEENKENAAEEENKENATEQEDKDKNADDEQPTSEVPDTNEEQPMNETTLEEDAEKTQEGEPELEEDEDTKVEDE